jgi:hypothetical protein
MNDIAIFIENHRGPDPSNLDQLCSQSAIDALVGFYHFLILSTVVLSLTCISIASARDGAMPWRGGGVVQLERGRHQPDGCVREWRGKEPWTVSH